jgi:hypothetical protein
MNYKILYWVDQSLITFGLAKVMQDKGDFEQFAIFDCTNKPKKFYNEQGIINFKKIWFYHDFIKKSNQHPNYEYLRKIENDYEIDLWKLAFNERIFNRFNEYHSFTEDEILLILEQTCKLFEQLVDEISPDFIVMTLQPNSQQNFLLHSICKKRGIKILMVSPTGLKNRYVITEDPEKLDDFSMEKVEIKKEKSFSEIKEFHEANNTSDQIETHHNTYQNSNWMYLKAASSYLFNSSDNTKTHYTYYGRTKFKVTFKLLLYTLRKRLREKFLDKNLSKKIDISRPFIYFPLQMEMERVLLIGAPFHTNQLEIIKNIIKSMPIGYKLVVKEHPSQMLRGWRKISDYKEIMNLPNVKLLHWSVPSKDIIEKCSLVISIKSSSSIEAALRQKPSIIFSNVGFNLPNSIHKILDIIELPKLIKKLLNSEVDLTDLNRYVNLMEKISFVFKFHEIDNGFKNYFQKRGYFVDNYILESKMKECITEYYKELEILANEYIKKIHIHSSEIKN